MGLVTPKRIGLRSTNTATTLRGHNHFHAKQRTDATNWSGLNPCLRETVGKKVYRRLSLIEANQANLSNNTIYSVPIKQAYSLLTEESSFKRESVSKS
jgi:hypothetical protein